MPVSLEVTTTINLPDFSLQRSEGPVSITTAGDAEDSRKVSIGTTEETVTIITDVTGGNGPGYMFLMNHDGANYVEVGFATGVYVIRLNAGYPSIMPLAPGVTQLFMKANTAACIVEFRIHER